MKVHLLSSLRLKTHSVLVLCLFFIFLTCTAYSHAKEQQTIPTELGGFILGSQVSDYPDIEYSNYLKDVVVTNWHGFRKGLISYGVCDRPGTIVKLQMKYEDSSERFYKKLFSTFKKRFGEPTVWEGDSFGVLQKWKWRFTDKKGREINMTLQHNSQDPNHNIGNQVKLYLPEQEERERLCFIRSCELPENEAHKKRQEENSKFDWDMLIPQ